VDKIDFIYSLIGTPLGYILYFIYEIGITNIGIAIILFTLIVKLAMLPLSIKQQKNTAKSAVFAPKVREIQQKYRNNQQKQQEELAKLQQQGYNPMGGCGSMLLTFLILFGVLDVVYKPMTHITHTPASEINMMVEESYSMKLASIFVDANNATASELEGEELKKHDELVRDSEKILAYYNANLAEGDTAYDDSVWNSVSKDSMKVVKGAITAALKNEYEVVKANNNGNGKDFTFIATDFYGITDYAQKDAAGNELPSEKDQYNALSDDAAKKAFMAEHSLSDSTKSTFSTMQSQYGYYGMTANGTISFTPTSSLQRELYILDTFGTVKEYNGNKVEFRNLYSLNSTENINELYNNLDFLGIKLSQIPGEHMGFPMLFMPIAAFVFSLLQTFISNRQMEKNNPGQVGGGMKITMYILPIFSLILVFSVPAGAGFYWTISYVFGIAQTILLNKLYNPQKLRAQAEAEYNERMKRVEVQAQKVRNAQNDNILVEYNGEKLTQKEINRRKLAEARRQDAIKYGEEYIEDEDDK